MNCPGYELLACPAFPCDQNGAVGWSSPSHQLINIAHRLALADDDVSLIFRLQLLTEMLVLNHQGFSFQSPVNGNPQCIRGKRLGDIVIRSQFYGLYSRFDGRIPCHYQDSHTRIQLLQSTKRFDSPRAGHFQIKEDKVEWFAAKFFNGPFPTVCNTNFVAFFF